MFDLLVVVVVVAAKHLPSGIWNSMEINFFCFALLCFAFISVFLAWLFFQYVFLFFSLLFSSSSAAAAASASCRCFIFIFTFVIFGIFPVLFFFSVFCSRFHFRPKFSVFV